MPIVNPSKQQSNLYTSFCYHLNDNGGRMDANDAVYYDFLDKKRVKHEDLMIAIKLCCKKNNKKVYVEHRDARSSGNSCGSFFLTRTGLDIVSNVPFHLLPAIIPLSESERVQMIYPPVDKKEEEKKQEQWTREEVVHLLTCEAHNVGKMLGTGYDLLEPIHGEWIKNWLINPESLRVVIHQAHRDSYKCFGDDTMVMMSDGKSKKITEVQVGEYVMGWDSTPRLVLDKYSGDEQMYKVTMNKNGESYTCNKNHILTLKQRPIKNNKFHCVDKYRYEGDKNIINIPIEDFIKSSASRTNGTKNNETFFKHFKVGVDFEAKDVKIPPYLLGAWLGDGNTRGIALTAHDDEPEVVAEFDKWVKSFGLKLRVSKRDGSSCSTFNYAIPKCKIGMNPVINIFKSYGLIGNKHIPHDYLQNSRENRLQLLAGLIDTDGCYCNSGKKSGNFTYTTNLKQLAKQVEWLARSLGYHAMAKEVPTFHTYKGEKKHSKSWQVYINGKDIHEIPTKIERKKAVKKDSTVHLSFSQKIEPIGMGKFTGISISGDGMFLLDNFMVVHNTSSLRLALAIWLITQPLKTFIVIRKSEDAVKEIVNGVSKILDTPLFQTFISILYPDIKNKGGFKKTTDTALAIDTNLNVSLSGEYQLRALGLGSPLTGKHSSIIITDDIVTTSDRESEPERRATIMKYQEMMNLLSNNKGFSDTRIINIGTPWHEEDAFQLMERGLKPKIDIQKEIEETPEKDRTEKQQEAIRQLNMLRGKSVYNCYQTGLMDESAIEWKKQVLNDDVLFQANYMLSLVSDKEKPFPRISNIGKYSKSYFNDAFEVFAQIDAKYGGSDTCALTIASHNWDSNETVVYGRLWKQSLDQNYMELAEIMFNCEVDRLFMETNTDKGLMGDKFRGLGFDVEGYHESQNKHTKIVSTIRPFWRDKADSNFSCLQFVSETDEAYMSQIHDYRRGIKKDDAPDSLSSIILRAKFESMPVSISWVD